MKISILLTSALLSFTSESRQAGGADPESVQVLVLGSWHMDDPGMDLVNMKAADVLSDAKQAELEDVALALAAFEPTKVMVERVVENESLAYGPYAEFSEELLRSQRSEVVQLGFRLAHRSGLTDVLGVDWPGDFPFEAVQAYAQSAGRAQEVTELVGVMQNAVRWLEQRQSEVTVRELLRECNDPEFLQSSHELYMEMLAFGRGEQQPGADLVAQWYERNVRIFSRAVQVTEPGERVVMIFGLGHAHLLRHFVREMPGYELVEVSDVL